MTQPKTLDEQFDEALENLDAIAFSLGERYGDIGVQYATNEEKAALEAAKDRLRELFKQQLG